jgi:hypothetical protein
MKKIVNAYYDISTHVMPKAVKRIFTLMKQYAQLDEQLSQKRLVEKDKQDKRLARQSIEEELTLAVKLFVPNDCTHDLSLFNNDKVQFFALTIMQELHEEDLKEA